ncbi:MAG: transposase [Flavobacterium sp.]|uniref:transposase n=1 Tax=Flavobacterium sp. TaxID=239 RepID=UPI0022C5BC19|nr:transposase [Flavobacterium sp.]MCZ8296404.1 hypothetical protein [Flavobacterium sp.]
MKKFKNKYRIPSSRLQNHDYGANGIYFITICTKNRKHYFGHITETHDSASPPEKMHDSASPSEKTHDSASPTEKTNHFASQSPTETHNSASLCATEIGKIAQKYWAEIADHYPFVTVDTFVVMPDHLHGILIFNNPDKKEWTPNQFGPQSKNLAAVIRGFKSSTKRYANQNGIEFEWQPRFHESILKDEKALQAVRRYIINNPKKWLETPGKDAQ